MSKEAGAGGMLLLRSCLSASLLIGGRCPKRVAVTLMGDDHYSDRQHSSDHIELFKETRSTVHTVTYHPILFYPNPKTRPRLCSMHTCTCGCVCFTLGIYAVKVSMLGGAVRGVGVAADEAVNREAGGLASSLSLSLFPLKL